MTCTACIWPRRGRRWPRARGGAHHAKAAVCCLLQTGCMPRSGGVAKTTGKRPAPVGLERCQAPLNAFDSGHSPMFRQSCGGAHGPKLGGGRPLGPVTDTRGAVRRGDRLGKCAWGLQSTARKALKRVLIAVEADSCRKPREKPRTGFGSRKTATLGNTPAASLASYSPALSFNSALNPFIIYIHHSSV